MSRTVLHILLLARTAVVTGLSVGGAGGADGAQHRRAARMPPADGANVGIELDVASSPIFSRRAALGGLGLASSACLCGGMPNAAHACTPFQEAAFAKAMSVSSGVTATATATSRNRTPDTTPPK